MIKLMVPDDSGETPDTTTTAKQEETTNTDTLQKSPKALAEAKDTIAPANSDEGEKNLENDTNLSVDHWKKRYADVQSFSQKRANEKDKLINELREQLQTNQVASLPSSPEELAEFEKEQPQLFNMITRIVEQTAITTKTDLGKALQEVESKTRQLSNAKGLAEVAVEHPDVYDIKTSAEFVDWFELQSEKLQGLINDDNATVQDIVFVLNKFKTDTGKSTETQSKKNKKLEKDKKAKAVKDAAIGLVPSKSSPDSGGEGQIYSESMIENETKKNPKWFDSHETEIDKARKEDRFIYDISKPYLYMGSV